MLEGLDPLAKQDVRRLVDENVDVLGHENVRVDTGIVTCPSLFEQRFGEVFGFKVGEVGETVVTAEGRKWKDSACWNRLSPHGMRVW